MSVLVQVVDVKPIQSKDGRQWRVAQCVFPGANGMEVGEYMLGQRETHVQRGNYEIEFGLSARDGKLQPRVALWKPVQKS